MEKIWPNESSHIIVFLIRMKPFAVLYCGFIYRLMYAKFQNIKGALLKVA